MLTIRVTPGTGGPDATDARDKCLAMIRGYCLRARFTTAEQTDEWPTAKILVYTLLDTPDAALAGMHGVHRFVGISPHDPQHRRQTSFAVVDVSGAPVRTRDGEQASQVRSYVTAPYERAKDHANDMEADVHAVLAGEIERLVSP